MRAGHRPLRRMARAGRRLLRRMLARASRRRACPQRTGTPHSREWGARAVVARAVAAMYQPLTPITGQSYLRKLSQLCTFLFRALCLPSPPSPPLVRPPGSERASSPREMREHSLPPRHSLLSRPLPLSFAPAPSFACQLSFLISFLIISLRAMAMKETHKPAPGVQGELAVLGRGVLRGSCCTPNCCRGLGVRGHGWR